SDEMEGEPLSSVQHLVGKQQTRAIRREHADETHQSKNRDTSFAITASSGCSGKYLMFTAVPTDGREAFSSCAGRRSMWQARTSRPSLGSSNSTYKRVKLPGTGGRQTRTTRP